MPLAQDRGQDLDLLLDYPLAVRVMMVYLVKVNERQPIKNNKCKSTNEELER